MADAVRTVSASRIADLLGDFDRAPAYAGLAEALRELVGDGRVGVGLRLPSERELTGALGVSRTTITRAYAVLREAGYVEARQGSGTFTRVPGGRARLHDRALTPNRDDPDLLDLTCAAPSAPPGIGAAYAAAAAELPAYLSGHGYFPHGLPALQAAVAGQYEERGLPTRPEQIMITPGALSAAAVVARALTGPRDRVLVEQPVYPNAVAAIRSSGARVSGVPVDPDGWGLDVVGRALREVRPTLTYLIADFQNPTGHVMGEEQRAQYGAYLATSGAVALVDEANQALALDGQTMPLPFACFAPDAITVGSASKAFWGGLRLGWIRCPNVRGSASAHLLDRLTGARLALDLGAPVMEQLVLTRLLADPTSVLGHRRDQLRTQRDALLAALDERLPSWTYVRPGGGLVVWCRLPARTRGRGKATATDLAVEAERRGLVVTPGPVFAVEGGLDRFVRLPWGRPAAELDDAVERLAGAWEAVGRRPGGARRRAHRVMVA